MKKNTSGRRVASRLCFCMMLTFSCAVSADQSLTPVTSNIDNGEILWDKFGIPHIYGPTALSVARGLGYAQMANHAETLLTNIAMARGRASEYFGVGANNEFLDNDIAVHNYGITDRASAWLQAGGIEQRTLINAAVSGMNKYARTHADTIDQSFLQILPITSEDVLALFQYIVNFNFQLEQSGIPKLLTAWSADNNATAGSAMVKLTSVKNGSNSWALAPSKTMSGNTVLVGNPHLPWGNNQPLPGLGIFQWMEVNLVIGNPAIPTLNASGATFPGIPFIAVGHNDYLGWTHTNNTLKNADLYEIKLTGPNSYLWEGKSRLLERHTDRIKVLQSNGTYLTQTIDIYNSVHGPVIARKQNKALALRVAGLDAPSPVSQYWGMIKASTLNQFIAANSALQMPFFNVIYADRAGHIMYLFGGRQPIRSGGNFYDWLGVLPGDKSNALWTRTLSWNQLPRTIDPPGGFVQNSNDAPWTSTFPSTIQASAFPRWISPEFMELRAQQNANFLLSRSKFDVESLIAGKMSTRVTLAERLLPDLISASRASSNATANTAADVLTNWDLNADSRSLGAILFERWYELYSNDSTIQKDNTMFLSYSRPAFRIGWNPLRPLTTPVGLFETTVAVKRLIEAWQQISSQYGTANVAWGNVHRTVLMDHDKTYQTMIPVSNNPVSGAGDILGTIRTVESFPSPDGQYLWSYGGDGYIQVVEFTKNGVNARSLLTYGNASRPGSTHITDQLPMFDAKQLRPSYRSRAEVEANTVLRETY